MKYYAVAKGRKTGIFTSWSEAQKHIIGFTGAVYKSFSSRIEAENFLNIGGSQKSTQKNSVGVKSRESYPPDAVIVYTDGGAVGNPGPGGYGVVIKDGDSYKELKGGYNLTTNNRMEMMAVITALKELKGLKKRIILHSDSRYTIDSITKGWAKNWKRNNWIKSDKKPALNADLWNVILDLLKGLDISFVWVKGHAGNPLNERVDELANSTAKLSGHPDDTGYLKSI